MKKKLSQLGEITKIVANCVTVVMYFVKFFHEVAVLPGFSASGESTTHRVDHYYSIFDKFSREGIAYLLWISVGIICQSIALCIISLSIKDNKKLKIASHVVFGVSLAFFFALLFVACSIQYAY